MKVKIALLGSVLCVFSVNSSLIGCAAENVEEGCDSWMENLPDLWTLMLQNSGVVPTELCEWDFEIKMQENRAKEQEKEIFEENIQQIEEGHIPEFLEHLLVKNGRSTEAFLQWYKSAKEQGTFVSNLTNENECVEAFWGYLRSLPLPDDYEYKTPSPREEQQEVHYGKTMRGLPKIPTAEECYLEGGRRARLEFMKRMGKIIQWRE